MFGDMFGGNKEGTANQVTELVDRLKTQVGLSDDQANQVVNTIKNFVVENIGVEIEQVFDFVVCLVEVRKVSSSIFIVNRPLVIRNTHAVKEVQQDIAFPSVPYPVLQMHFPVHSFMSNK